MAQRVILLTGGEENDMAPSYRAQIWGDHGTESSASPQMRGHADARRPHCAGER